MNSCQHRNVINCRCNEGFHIDFVFFFQTKYVLLSDIILAYTNPLLLCVRQFYQHYCHLLNAKILINIIFSLNIQDILKLVHSLQNWCNCPVSLPPNFNFSHTFSLSPEYRLCDGNAKTLTLVPLNYCSFVSNKRTIDQKDPFYA